VADDCCPTSRACPNGGSRVPHLVVNPTRRTRPVAAITLLTAFLMFITSAAQATSYSWNASSGDWFTNTNWSPIGVPGSGDNVTIGNSGTCILNSDTGVTNFTLSNGTLDGSGTLSASGTTSWSGGSMTGSGATSTNGPLSIANGGSISLNRILNSNVGATWTGTGSLFMNGGTLNIAAGTTFDMQNDGFIGYNGGTTAINNAGTFQKSAGTGTSTDQGVPFNNTGSTKVLTGTLALGGGGTSSGSFDATGTTLVFSGGTHTLSSAVAITGANVTFSGGTVNHPGSYNVTSTTTVSGGTANFTGTSATLNTVVLSSGLLNISTSTALSIPSLTQSGGELSGSALISVTGTTSWSGGSMTGSGATSTNGPLSIANGGSISLNRILNSNVGATWTGTGSLFMNGGTLNIAAGTTFDMQNDGFIGYNGGTTAINNAGTFQKSAGTGTSTDQSVPLTNTGIVQSLSGTISFIAAYTQTAGATRLNGGAIASASTMSIQGGTIDGNGTLTANVNNSGGAAAPGLSPGLINEAGAYAQGASGAFHVEIGGLTAGTQYDRYAISGTATLNGSLNISLINGYVPSLGDSFTIMTFASHSGDFSSMTGQSIGNGTMFQRTVSPTNVVLTVILAPSPTPTLTGTPTNSPTTTPTASVTATPTPSPTVSPTPTPEADHYIGYHISAPARDALHAPIPGNLFPKNWVITIDDVHITSGGDDPENFLIKRAVSVLNPAQANTEAGPTLPDRHYLRYSAALGTQSVGPLVNGKPVKPPKHVKRIWDLANQFGTIKVLSKKLSAVWVPANVGLGASPPAAGDAPHFACYTIAATTDLTDQTPAGRNGKGKFRKDLQGFFRDQLFDDCAKLKDGVTPSFQGSPVQGMCLLNLLKPFLLCDPMSKSAVQPPRSTSAIINGSTAVTTKSLLCYRVGTATAFRSSATAALAGVSVGTKIKPAQAPIVKRRVASGSGVYTGPGNLFPGPAQVNETRREMVCIPTDVNGATPAP